MRQIQADGTTIVIVTHNLQMLDRMAPRGVLLHSGRVTYDGPVEARCRPTGRWKAGRRATTRPRVRVELLAEDGAATRHFASGGTVHLRAQVDDELDSPVLGVMVAPLGLGAAYGVRTSPGGYAGGHSPGRPLSAEIGLTDGMMDGSYSVTVGVHDATGGRQFGSSERTGTSTSPPASPSKGAPSPIRGVNASAE
jgi:hypothetical protein